MSNVKLAIRVRPFTEKELRSDKDRVAVVDIVDDKTVTITNIKVSLSGAGDSRERIRRYYADYTFDSSCAVTEPTYATQNKVFESIGRSVISSVSQGCSACVLAYGQSATGKTHTMLGTEAQPGLIPRLCKALFEQQQSLEFTISFLEIYNERVHDLLCGETPLPTCHSLPRRKGNARKDLRVREHPQRGTYVQNLRRVSVHNAEALLALVTEGVKRRRTGATKRNCTSSRSHALLEIATPHATLHLADLAGSEKASWEGFTGGRQKEGASINKSLVALSNVISALVNGGAGRGRFVPYRDSALTWLLKDCFVCGSNIFIIATVSPSAACYGESASTLRWAARARQLPTPRTINSCTSFASRAALQAQFNLLIAELTSNHIRYNPETGKLTFDELHWQSYKNDFMDDDLMKSAKIGNIMNLTRPQTGANNLESTPSSVGSGSSDVMNVIDKNIIITNEVSKEVDNVFHPVLERTSSGDNIKIVPPLRHKRRQCKSQEALIVDETTDANETPTLNKIIPSQSELQLDNIKSAPKQKIPQITILHDNQRAEIVASVTERLYSKLKKKEQTVVPKLGSIEYKKIVEPLSELKICANARKKLMELSQKAIKNRRKIGIPVHTQTKNIVTRVKDQAIDVQTDLYSYGLATRDSYIIRKDVATETVPTTVRFKDIAIGPNGSVNVIDRATVTKPLMCKNSFMMTDLVLKTENCTQTQVIPPPRRRKRAKNPLKRICNHTEESSVAPVISIKISHTYPVDAKFSSSDDDSQILSIKNHKTSTPDLLTNHNTTDTSNVLEAEDAMGLSLNILEDETSQLVNAQAKQEITNSNKFSEEFSDTEVLLLPRVNPKTDNKIDHSDIKNMILGRSENKYPYNIVLSPPKEKDAKRLVKFKDINVVKSSAVSKTEYQDKNIDVENDYSSVATVSDTDFAIFNEYNTYSDSIESSKVDTDSFIWKKVEDMKTIGSINKSYVPVYKGSKYKSTKARTLKYSTSENSDDHIERSLPRYESSHNINDNISSIDSLEIDSNSKYKFEQSKSNLSCKFNHKNEINNYNLEKKLNISCNNLEESLTSYENYMANTKRNIKTRTLPTLRRPREYLQHLVQLRKEVVKGESDITDGSVEENLI